MEYLKLGGEYRLKNGENVILIGTAHELHYLITKLQWEVRHREEQ